ncbi:unnamed protein product, partial [Soboliphyme baturini]|uniref:Uncharacterized protein n=1 Tax=Soboliphyme baturini TaxID=241478 RepID=A0A183IUU1_9BILA
MAVVGENCRVGWQATTVAAEDENEYVGRRKAGRQLESGLTEAGQLRKEEEEEEEEEDDGGRPARLSDEWRRRPSGMIEERTLVAVARVRRVVHLSKNSSTRRHAVSRFPARYFTYTTVRGANVRSLDAVSPLVKS